MNSEASEYFRLIGILGGILIFAFVALRFWMPKLVGLRGSNAGPLKVAGHLTLEPRKTIYVIRAGMEYFMVSASEAGVRLLTPLSAEGFERAQQDVASPRSIVRGASS